MYSETEHRGMAEEQKIKNLKRQIEHFEEKIEQLAGKGLDNHIVIKDLTLDHPVVEKLTFHLDQIQLKELSGAMNLGNNFGVNVRPKPQSKTKPKSKTSEQQEKSPSNEQKEKEKPQEPQQNKNIHVKKKSKPQMPKQQKKKQHPQDEPKKQQDEKKPEEKISGASSSLPKTSVSPSSTKLTARRTENGYRIRF